MGVEFGTNNPEIQDKELQRANEERVEQNIEDHHKNSEILNSINTIDTEGERKQIDKRDDVNSSMEGDSKLQQAKSIEEEKTLEPMANVENDKSEQSPLQNNRDISYDNGEVGLSDKDKEKIKEETGWSNDIVDAARSLEEAEIYKKADLKEVEINGKKCLIRSDIDMEQKDELGRTNKERMENGNAPLNECGETIELHHIGQKQESPLAELTSQEHRGKGNDVILHDKQKESEIDRVAFAKERKQHWASRAEYEQS